MISVERDSTRKGIETTWPSKQNGRRPSSAGYLRNGGVFDKIISSIFFVKLNDSSSIFIRSIIFITLVKGVFYWSKLKRFQLGGPGYIL